ncbi:mitochondrial carnitine/acylcarnitine carrier protein-like [Folsomia candida]|uniref:mitochondrial carnitine/acylcarnitine carrier protein-like n=1 Tax=Folsomia candida TaxID=158441 RepID=UPI0016055B6F|nr:mitochondrial carnitine/acylcarnitine carrier protein-like [Folsomia candida]
MEYNLNIEVAQVADRNRKLKMMAAALFGGVAQVALMHPMDTVKVQTPETPQNYSGPMDCAKKLLANGGISNFYRGFWITYLRGISQVAVYFPTIRVINHYITPENGVMSMDRAFLAGMSASVVVWTAILPIDGVKTILQTAPAEGSHPKTCRSIVTAIYKNDGIPGFFRGVMPVALRTVIAISSVFGGLHVVMHVLNVDELTFETNA